MKNSQEQFAEFLRCCREQRVKRIHLAEPCLIINPLAGDFGSVLIEFEQSSYFITSKYLPHRPEDDEIDELCVKKYKRIDDLREDDLTEADIYKTLSGDDVFLSFLTEMEDADGYLNGLEWKCGSGYLFFIVSCPSIIVSTAANEETKHLLYPHQFGDVPLTSENCGKAFELFPDA